MEDVDADLLPLVRHHLHALLAFHRIALVVTEPGVLLGETPFLGLGVEVRREIDILLEGVLRLTGISRLDR